MNLKQRWRSETGREQKIRKTTRAKQVVHFLLLLANQVEGKLAALQSATGGNFCRRVESVSAQFGPLTRCEKRPMTRQYHKLRLQTSYGNYLWAPAQNGK
jgi:hypothetical protein